MGRWPANLIHDGSAELLAAFPAASGQKAELSQDDSSPRIGRVYEGERLSRGGEASASSPNHGSVWFTMLPGARRMDADSAARFFCCAKASRQDRNEGLASGSSPAVSADATMRYLENADWAARTGNHHRTVKPTDLMRYLCRLVTPAGGLFLDPYAGSGSTGRAAALDGFRFLGIEQEPAYAAIAEARIAAAIAAAKENRSRPAAMGDLFDGPAKTREGGRMKMLRVNTLLRNLRALRRLDHRRNRCFICLPHLFHALHFKVRQVGKVRKQFLFSFSYFDQQSSYMHDQFGPHIHKIRVWNFRHAGRKYGNVLPVREIVNDCNSKLVREDDKLIYETLVHREDVRRERQSVDLAELVNITRLDVSQELPQRYQFDRGFVKFTVQDFSETSGLRKPLGVQTQLLVALLFEQLLGCISSISAISCDREPSGGNGEGRRDTAPVQDASGREWITNAESFGPSHRVSPVKIRGPILARRTYE